MNFFEKIEYKKILSIISEYCHSNNGKNKILNLRPLKDIDKINKNLDIITEIQNILKIGISFNFENIEELDEFLSYRKHEVLSFEEIKKVYFVLRLCNNIISQIEDFHDYPNYIEIVSQLIEFKELEKKYIRTFSEKGEILDSASAELQYLRRKQVSLRKHVIQVLTSKFEDLNYKDFISESIITQRNDRYVIPVKESGISFVSGISHGSSASKATVYFEPKEVVQFNNDIENVKSEERKEIYRIQKEFSDKIYCVTKELISNAKILIQLDAYFAISKFSNDIRSKKPKIINDNYINLKNARHPLLIISLKDYKKVIPFDLTLGKEYNIVIISGPNTGGKTVTLKAVGLLTAMALTGIPIPVNIDSEIGVFYKFFADIGDNQSLEDALSTFASHIKTMKEILKYGDEKTLILVDEIGSSTDPEQGSALAQVFLEELVRKNMVGIITTHFTPLKVFAEKSNKCVNASMQFDPQKHLPTYKLKLGIPGNSFALEIASQLGLDEQLINKAKSLVGKQSVELSDLLKKLSEEKAKLAKSNYEYSLKAKLYERKASEYDDKITQFEENSKELKKKSIREARDYLVGLQKKLTSEIDLIKKEESKRKKEEAEKLLNKVVTLNKDFEQKETELHFGDLIPVSNPKIGDIVFVKDMEATAVIVEIFKNEIKVDMNGFFFTTKKNKIYKTNKTKTNSAVSITNFKSNKVKEKASFEVKVLGLTFDEAKVVIDEFIDDSILNGFEKIRIVHGKGTGTLRRKIRQYLKRDKRVKDMFSPAPEAGGDGVTVVSFT